MLPPLRLAANQLGALDMGLVVDLPLHRGVTGQCLVMRVQRGVHLVDERKYDEAIEVFNSVLARDPSNAEAFLHRGRSWDRKAEHDRAISDFSITIHLNGDVMPMSADAFDLRISLRNAYMNRGRTYEDQSDYVRALADYDKSIALFPNQSDAWLARGRCRLKLHQSEAAVADFTRVIQMRPSDGHGYRSRADALRSLGRDDEALPDLDRAIELDFDASGASH